MRWTSHPELTASTLKFQHARLKSEEAGHLLAIDTLREQLATLEQRAKAAGLSKLFRELKNPPPPAPLRVEEPLVRVKVLASFGGTWRDLAYDGAEGSIIDVPRSYAAHARELFEIVDPATPLYRPHVVYPR